MMLASVCEMFVATAVITCSPAMPASEAEWLYRQRTESREMASRHYLRIGLALDGWNGEGTPPEITGPFVVKQGDPLWHKVPYGETPINDNPPTDKPQPELKKLEAPEPR